MHFFKTSHVFDHPWEQVTCANWRKYPNEITTHVTSVDVLRREVRNGCLYSERLICIEQSIPKFVAAIIGTQTSYAREVSIVDPVNKTLTLRTQNLTACSILKVYETVTYRPDRNDPTKTYFEQEAKIQASVSWKPVRSRLEAFSLERFEDNAALGKKAFESVLRALFGHQETITAA